MTAPELEVIVIVWQNNHRFVERIGVAVDEGEVLIIRLSHGAIEMILQRLWRLMG